MVSSSTYNFQSNQSQNARAHESQAYDCQPRPIDPLVRQLPPSIPNQMPNAVKRMEGKRHRNTEFDEQLRSKRQRPERSRHTSTVEMPSEQGSAEVGRAKNVEAPAEDAAGDAIEG